MKGIVTKNTLALAGLLSVGVLSLATTQQAEASLFTDANVTLNNPDITSTSFGGYYGTFEFTDTDGNATDNTGSLSITGVNTAFLENVGVTTPTPFSSYGLFSLDAIFNNGALESGSYQINGAVAGYGLDDNSELLTGTLTNFAIDGGSLELLFDVTGGAMNSLFGGIGGMIIGTSGFDLAGNYSDDHYTADTMSGSVSVPEPGTLSLLALGLATLGFRNRRSTK